MEGRGGGVKGREIGGTEDRREERDGEEGGLG